MKILGKTIIYTDNIERYDLNDIFSNKSSNKGLIICYLLTTHENVQLISLELEAEHEEIGVPIAWHKRYSKTSFKNTFNSLESFLNGYDYEDFGIWKLIFLYQNIEIDIIGGRKRTDIGLSYPIEAKVNLLPLLDNIEKISYQYNNFDKNLLNLIKNEYKMTEQKTVKAIQKLQLHMDIYEEFIKVFTSNKFQNISNAIIVEGYTAEQLNKLYPLSILGSYNYLIYLRENPKEALEDLKKGLPRK